MEGTLKRQVKSLAALDEQSLEILRGIPAVVNEWPLPGDFRSVLKKKSLFFYKAMVENLQPFAEKIEEMHQCHRTVTGKLKDLQTEVNESLTATSLALRSSNKLSSELAHVSHRKKVLGALLGKLKLSSGEEELLKGATIPFPAEFFVVLEKLQSISDHSLLLDAHDSRILKISVDDYVSTYSEIAYEKLFRFVQEQCRVLQREKVQLLPRINAGIGHLRKRPIYYAHCRDELIRSRQQWLLRRFRDTLTGGEDPLEAHLAEPVRFVGECFAWISSNVLDEKQLIEGLLGSIEVLKSEGNNIEESTVLDKITNPLKADLSYYIETLVSKCGSLQCFQLLALFDFYITNYIEMGLMSYASAVIQLLYTLSTLFEEKFAENIAKSVSKIRLFSISTDLRVPRAFSEEFRDFLQILNIIKDNSRFEAFYQGAYTEMVEKVLSYYKTEAQSALDKERECVLILNFVLYLKFSLAEYEFTVGEIEKLEGELKVYETELIETIVKDIVKLYKLTPQNVPRNLKNLYEDLYTAGGLELPILGAISNENFKRTVHAKVAEKILEIYSALQQETEDTPDPEKIQLILRC